jgi:ankyrin repeat protein
MFETILNTESDKNPRNDYCTTPFHLICSNGNLKFAELLLKNLMPTSTTSDIYDLVMIIHDNNLNLKSNFKDTGYFLSEALILASINSNCDDRLFFELQIQYMSCTSNCSLFSFWHSEQFDVDKMYWPCSFLVLI